MRPKQYINRIVRAVMLAGAVPLLTFCSGGDRYTEVDRPAAIFPDYREITIPYNIAPLNFRIEERAEKFRVSISGSEGHIDVASRSGIVRIPQRKWRKFLLSHKDRDITVGIEAKTDSGWIRYPGQSIFVSSDPVDPCLVYRLIEPGYAVFGNMGIYQRDMGSFRESPIMLNALTGTNCMNCHSFSGGDPETMLFHMRQNFAGTVIVRDGSVNSVDTKFPEEISAGVYPRWHPDGRHVAFSVNETNQSFHTQHSNVLEVYDHRSDIILYDTGTHTIATGGAIHAEDRFETFPEWSPDGRYLYFCSAVAQDNIPQMLDSLHYDLFRVSYDPGTSTFGTKIDTVFVASTMGKSVSFPRISPDGQYIVFCVADYGTFPIWQQDSELYLMDLESGEAAPFDEVNSSEGDSYHTWSSSGRWMVMGSRRLDGLYTRPFVFYFDREGKARKPFLLPQKDPGFYDNFLKSYNVPEFVTGKVEITPRKIERVVKK